MNGISMVVIVFLLTVVICTNIQPTRANQYCVVPTEQSPCSCSETCHTFDYYLSNTTQYFVSGVIFEFLPGIHEVNKIYSGRGIINMSFTGTNDAFLEITSGNETGTWFTLHDSESISFSGLSFQSNQLLFHFMNVTSIEMTDVVLNSTCAGTTYVQNTQILFLRNVILQASCPNTSSFPPAIKVSLENNTNMIDVAYILMESVSLTHSHSDGIEIDCSMFTGSCNINIISSSIVHHFGKALSIALGENSDEVVIQDSILKWNHGNIYIPGIAMQITQSHAFSYLTSVQMKNVTFDSNHFSSGYIDGTVTALLQNIGNATIIDCTFKNNTGAALFLESSSVTAVGNVSFIDNVAYNGAALIIGGYTTINVSNETTLLFTNNIAHQTGGAIYISTTTYNNIQFALDQLHFRWCFISPLPFDDVSQWDPVLIFDNNTASNGGDAIFGGNLNEYWFYDINQSCNDIRVNKKCIDGVKHLSNFIQKTPSPISSSSLRVCLCETDTVEPCLEYKKHIEVYPGQTVTIAAYTVGQQFGISGGCVYAQILNKSSTVSISNEDRVQTVGIHNCNDSSNDLSYKITTAEINTSERLILTAEDVVVSEYVDEDKINATIDEYKNNLTCNLSAVPPQLLTLPVYITLDILECPKGFVLRKDSYGCVCANIFNSHLGRERVSCDIDTQKIERQYSVWVDADNTTTKYSQHCPLLYCHTSVIKVSLSKKNGADEQCKHHHSGILCGGCQTNYSLAIGSSNCLRKCSDKYLSLLLVFAVAGVLLVLFIKFLNLTITQGMVSGLIFYANIVQTNKDVLLSSDETPVRVLSAFVAWLNLDFGIETCFSSSLDIYLKTWLQFAFPLYLWVLAGGIILACRYSQLATKFFGNNAVQVLATIFLLSYNKILRTIIIVCSVSIIQTQSSDSETISEDIVWTYDGNISFFGSEHALLFAFCTLVFLFHWLPFTLYVLLGQWLQRYNHYWGLRWIGKLRPLLDAYYGPLKDCRHYWVGILLLARAVVILPAAIPYTSNSISLLIIIFLGLALLFILASIGKVYRKYYLSILETSLIVNLIFFAVLSLYLDSTGGKQEIAVYISVGFSLILFLLIIIGQICLFLAKCKKCRSHHSDYADIDKEDMDHRSL